MAKFVYSNYEDKKVRVYTSNVNKNCQYYTLIVNLKDNIFKLSLTDAKQSFFRSYLSLPCNPKKILDNLGYCLDDFLDYDSVIGFLTTVIKHVKTNGNNINASFSRYFIADFDLELF